MKIIPQENIVHLDLKDPEAGVLDTSSRKSAMEFGTVVAVGSNVTTLKKGDKVFVKSWAIDIIHYEDKDYYFCNITTKGIVAVIQ